MDCARARIFASLINMYNLENTGNGLGLVNDTLLIFNLHNLLIYSSMLPDSDKKI